MVLDFLKNNLLKVFICLIDINSIYLFIKDDL